MAILLVIALLSCIGIAFIWLRTLALSCVAGAVLWGAWLLFTSEVLSLFYAIEYVPLLLVWTVPLCVFIGAVAYDARMYGLSFFGLTAYLREKVLSYRQSPHHTWGVWESLSVLYLLCVFSATFLIAWHAAPQNVDSFRSHMTRPYYWAQYGSIHNFPTHSTPQLRYEPMAHVISLHSFVLSGYTDRFVNFGQWFSMVIAVIGIGYIIHILKGSRRAQWLGMVCAASLPMGIMQATSVQVDYVASATFVLALALMCVSFKTRFSLPIVVLWSLAVGLALWTKATNYFYIFPLILWYCVCALTALRWRAWRAIVPLMVLPLLMNLPHYYRNWQLHGHPLGLSYSRRIDIRGEAPPSPYYVVDMARTLEHEFVAPEAGSYDIFVWFWNAGRQRFNLYVNAHRVHEDIDVPRTFPNDRTHAFHMTNVTFEAGAQTVWLEHRGGFGWDVMTYIVPHTNLTLLPMDDFEAVPVVRGRWPNF